MQRRSPLMKGLVETRARADAGLHNALNAVARHTERLNKLAVRFERASEGPKSAIAISQNVAEEALRVRNACDQFIRKLDQGIDPSEIKPVDGWQGRYGPRGALGKAVAQFIESAYPNTVTTREVAAEIQKRYRLSFATASEWYAWKQVTIRGRLGSLCRAGRIERFHDVTIGNTEPGRWRWIPPSWSNLNLQALAAQAGLPTTAQQDSVYDEAPSASDEDDLPR